MIELNGKNYEKALDYFTTSLPETPAKYIDSAPIYFYIGEIYSVTQRCDNAIYNYDKALEIYPMLTAAYNNRGIAFIQGKGDYENAIMFLATPTY